MNATRIEELVEEAIQISHRMLGALDALKQQRAELSSVCTKLGDEVVSAEKEEWKRNALATYRAQIDQVDAAIAFLDGKAMSAKRLQAEIEETLLRNLRILTEDASEVMGNEGVTSAEVLRVDRVAAMLRAAAANLAQGFSGRVAP